MEVRPLLGNVGFSVVDAPRHLRAMEADPKCEQVDHTFLTADLEALKMPQ